MKFAKLCKFAKLYAPAIVLAAMAIGTELELGQCGGLLYWVLAVAVVFHVQEETHR
jgi:hypothetical protein